MFLFENKFYIFVKGKQCLWDVKIFHFWKFHWNKIIWVKLNYGGLPNKEKPAQDCKPIILRLKINLKKKIDEKPTEKVCSYWISCSHSHLCNTLQHAFINVTAFGPPDIQKRSEGLRPFLSQGLTTNKWQEWDTSPVSGSTHLQPYLPSFYNSSEQKNSYRVF